MAPNAAPIAVAPGTCGRGSATRHENDHPGVLLHHVARGRPGGNKARLDHRRQWHHELLDRQLYRILSVPVLFGQWASGVEKDVDLARLVHDAVDVLVNGVVVERVNRSCVRQTPLSCDFLCHCFNARLRTTRQEDFSALC
jgi:hypothetical protein